MIVRDVAWPIVDLRVDWSDADPVAELGAIWDRYAPQIDDYVQRALDPTHAPAFGAAFGGKKCLVEFGDRGGPGQQQQVAENTFFALDALFDEGHPSQLARRKHVVKKFRV